MLGRDGACQIERVRVAVCGPPRAHCVGYNCRPRTAVGATLPAAAPVAFAFGNINLRNVHAIRSRARVGSLPRGFSDGPVVL